MARAMPLFQLPEKETLGVDQATKLYLPNPWNDLKKKNIYNIYI